MAPVSVRASPNKPPPLPPPPLRTKWTRLVHPSVLIGHERTRPARPALCGATAAAPSGWNAGAQKWPGKVAGRLPRRRPVSEPPPLPRRRPRSRATRPTSTGWYGSSRRCAPLSPPAATRLSKRDSILERAQLVRLGGTRRVQSVREVGGGRGGYRSRTRLNVLTFQPVFSRCHALTLQSVFLRSHPLTLQ